MSYWKIGLGGWEEKGRTEKGHVAVESADALLGGWVGGWVGGWRKSRRFAL